MRLDGVVCVKVLITCAMEDMQSSLFVCLSVSLSATLRKSFRTDLHKILSEGLHWPVNKRQNCGGDLEPIRQMAGLISRYWSEGLGGGMHCPSASSVYCN